MAWPKAKGNPGWDCWRWPGCTPTAGASWAARWFTSSAESVPLPLSGSPMTATWPSTCGAHPDVLHDFTAALVSVGLVPAGESPKGHQHRWVRDLASIDLLDPPGRRRGGRLKARRGRWDHVQAPGAQQAITPAPSRSPYKWAARWGRCAAPTCSGPGRQGRRLLGLERPGAPAAPERLRRPVPPWPAGPIA